MASDDDALPTLKILLIGPSGAGKSALLKRYCDDEFDPESSTATIGIDFKIKKLSVRGKPYRLTLFDTAGQERFRTLSTSFYRGAHGVLLVYDISSRASFLTMDRWFEEVENNTVPDVALYLVGTKLDKAETSRAVSVEEGEALAAAHGAHFCEASAKTTENIRKPFVEVVDMIVSNPALLAGKGRGRTAGTVDIGSGGDGEGYLSGCSC
ncbi:ras-domain-containing protein [Coniochaeta ligniaria NRRL 30616]|uniref:Ras-domain-containing protein n=1 Tax=Coniochaeta ligniaria NRRL 30616 TaxID=1408157 RepID=A0A1J7J9C5_9PEZI|nr:ras-domain-containing protein [Coniochaeta ligniaria NRRL 30616]